MREVIRDAVGQSQRRVWWPVSVYGVLNIGSKGCRPSTIFRSIGCSTSGIFLGRFDLRVLPS